MKTIDFLPPELLRQNEVRSLRWWWIGVCIAFAMFIGVSATLQWVRRSDVRAELARLQPQCESAAAQEQLIARLHQQLDKQSQIADLFAFLDHPWPRSRVLVELISPLPVALQVTQLQIAEQQLAEVIPRSVSATQVIVTQSSDDQREPAVEDYHVLWKRTSALRTVAQVQGITRELVQLHQYVAELGSSPLVESAKIESLEEVKEKGRSEMRFTIRVIIRPAFSFPGGPSPEPQVTGDRSLAAAGVAP